MILNEEIIKLANTYGFDRHISKTTHDIYWECDEEDLLKFAQKIYQMGYDDGGYDTSIVMGD
jgi:HD superfamily phosphohydrolase YqeK